MSKGIKILLVTLAVAGIAALSIGSLAMAAGGNAGDQTRDRVRECDETCLKQCLQAMECNQTAACLKEQQQQRLCQQNETCTQAAEQNRTGSNWQDETFPGNASGQQAGSQAAQGKKLGQG